MDTPENFQFLFYTTTYHDYSRKTPLIVVNCNVKEAEGIQCDLQFEAQKGDSGYHRCLEVKYVVVPKFDSYSDYLSFLDSREKQIEKRKEQSRGKRAILGGL